MAKKEDFFGLDLGPKIEEVLLDLEDLNRRKSYWNVARSTGVLLSAMVEFMGAENVLEIGTSSGYSGIFMAAALAKRGKLVSGGGKTGAKTGGKLYTVESHAERFELARVNFGRAGLLDYVELIKGHAPEIIDEVFGGAGSGGAENESGTLFDMVFIDATKMEYGSYLEAARPLLRRGGIVIGDNFLSHYESMKPFIEDIQNHEELESYLLPIDDGLLFCFKVG